MSNRGLGRGLDSLLGGSARSAKQAAEEHAVSLSVDLLQRGRYQPRKHMDETSLQELANSIIAQGIIQPIIVRPLADGQYEIIAGERRWRAAQLANLEQVPVVIRKVDDRAAIAMSLIENIQRDNLNPVEEAISLQRLIEEFALTQQQAAEAVGRSRPAVSNLLRLLALPDAIKQMLADGDIEMGHARALLGVEEPMRLQVALYISNNSMSVRAAEKYIKDMPAKAAFKKATLVKDPHITSLEKELSERVNAKVKLKNASNGSGRIVIYYNSLDELDGILGHVN